MSRLSPLGSRLQPAPQRQMATTNTNERRITGRRLQKRRLSMWTKDPHCAGCGRVVEYPHGFELDHKVPLHQGGRDTEDNCQVLCVELGIVDGRVVKAGCHADKSAAEMLGPT